MPKRILLADDSITIQKVVELTFSDGDYEIVTANNGARALQKLAESRPDIILSDIIMPEKNGYEVCEFVKSHPEYRDIPVILLTGTFEPFDPDRAEKAGCDAVVTKPFESQSLINKVEELIQRRQAVHDESKADPSDAFASQPLDSFVGSPAVDQSDEVPAHSPDAGMTMPWQMPTVDQSSEYADSPFSTEPPPPVGEPAEDSPFGFDSGWEPISADPAPAEESISAEPFEASAAQDESAMSQGFEGESIFAPEESGAESQNEPHDDSIFAGTSESAQTDGEPFSAAGQEPDSVPEDLSTRAWAVPVDGASAEPAALDAEPSSQDAQDSGFGRKIPFPGMPSDTALNDVPETDEVSTGSDADESSAIEETPTIVDEMPLVTAWSEQPGSSEEASREDEFSERAAGIDQTDDVWNMTPATEGESEEFEPAFAEPLDESTDAFESSMESQSPWETAEETPASEEGAHQEMPEAASEVRDSLAPGRTLTDDDVERIARRVVELMTPDTVKNIAWEVIPDIAEKVVRERVRELENE